MKTNQNLNETALLINCSLQVSYHLSENTIYFKGHMQTIDEHNLIILFRKIKKIIFLSKNLKFNLEQLEFIPHSGIALFYQLVKIRLDERIHFAFITSKEMQWQHNWLYNIEKLSKNAGNHSQISYQK